MNAAIQQQSNRHLSNQEERYRLALVEYQDCAGPRSVFDAAVAVVHIPDRRLSRALLRSA